MARIEHYQSLLARAHQRIVQTEREEKIGFKGSMKPQHQKNLICYDFLRTIAFFREDGSFSNAIRQELAEEMERHVQSRRGRTNEEVCALAVTVVILNQFNKIVGIGMPGFLLWESVRFAGGVLNDRLKEAGLAEVSTLYTELDSRSPTSEL